MLVNFDCRVARAKQFLHFKVILHTPNEKGCLKKILLKYWYIKANGNTVHYCLQRRKLIHVVTSHSTSQHLTIELLSECKSHINANNPCLHFKANASQVGGSPCSLQKNRVGWFSILVHKENQNFISIVTNINYFIYTGTYILLY